MKFFVVLIFAVLGLCECSDDGVGGDLPPPELQCLQFASCDTFPQNKVCGLAVDGCWRPYTFNNDCQLSLFNCEHPSTPFYKYWEGACYPDDEMVTISPIEREPVEIIT
ncbi:hypothetical protein HA402_002588 [Bradysia odoriphaga]|nr:hypothetical protein HA402_002588 [Bradysia odoriphaga]